LDKTPLQMPNLSSHSKMPVGNPDTKVILAVPCTKCIPRLHPYCLSLALCLQWYNGLIMPRAQSCVTKRTTVWPNTTDRQQTWNKYLLLAVGCIGL